MKYVGYITTSIITAAVAVGISVFSLNTLAEPEPSQREGEEPIDQGSICVAASDEQALDCPEGGLFLARLSLNNTDLQNPIILENRVLNTMALYCDTNFSIEHTQAGVLCVLTHQRISQGAPDEAAIDETDDDQS